MIRMKQSPMPGEGTRVHENRELDWARWVRRAAADRCALRRSAPTWAPALTLFSEQSGGYRKKRNQTSANTGISTGREYLKT